MIWPIVITTLLAWVGGYGWGLRVGRREGALLEHAASPLAIKEEALRTGLCPICNTSFDRPEQAENCHPGISMVE